MGLKKYEIITVGSDKRVRALRSWQVGDRYVNIGDVGGIVYDEKTLSQDGACWLFRGNFNFPGARIGGDSIVDVGEATLSAAGSPAVDILGSSVLVGSKLIFGSDQTAVDAVVLTADDFEQGGYASLAVGQKPGKDDGSANFIRTKNPIFMGGKSITIKTPVSGYIITILVTDADGYIIKPYRTVITDNYQRIPTDAGQYAYIRLTKNPVGPTVPADATAAQIAFTGTYETKLSIIDSRVEVNPANATGTATIKPGGTYTMALGAKYPEAIIRNSKVSINSPGAASRSFRLLGQIIGSTATLDATAGDVVAAGSYSNVKNITASGVLTTNTGVSAYNIIQATDCDNFAVSPTIFPGLAAARTANIPFIFQGCNMPGGIFYHHAQIANTYRDINFDLATADLGKTFDTDRILVSSEVNGMYRAWLATDFGALIESHESVKSLTGLHLGNSYNTTIYADAYLNGLFAIAGTNVFGNSMKHEASNTQNVMAVQGRFNTSTVGGKITGVVSDNTNVCVPTPFRVNGHKGLVINNLPAGYTALIFLTDANDVIATTSADIAGLPSGALKNCKAYIRFRKSDGEPIAPDDIKGVTVTTYNGCKIVNTGETAVNMKGNIRVEANATLVNASVTGSGYFGGNAFMSGAFITGCVYMRDNASFTKTAGSLAIRNLKMTENAYAVLGNYPLNGRIHLSDNARCTPTAAGLSGGDLVMKDNAVISGGVAVDGVITMKDDAKVSAGTVSAYGDITLCGSYNQTVNKTWTGKRTITDVDAPEYDDNVKTQYDF